MLSGSRPASRQRGSSTAGRRGGTPATDSAMWPMWSGVVPQQPPTMLTNPLVAYSFTSAAVSHAVSSYSPKAFGRPAFG